jgi:hypothetical protein
MIRPFAVSIAAGLAFASSAACGVGESFPVVHNEPITVRIVGGKDGRPLGRLHLTLIAGYDRLDMREQLFREEVLTDAQGQVRLSNQLANLPWLQVWVGKKSLCQEDAPKASFSVELIRRDGLSAPNHCGKATVEDKPGVITVFVKGKGAPSAPAIAAAAPTVPAAMMAPPTAAHAAGAKVTVSVPARCGCAGSKKARHRGNACKEAKTLLDGLGWRFRSNGSEETTNKNR